MSSSIQVQDIQLFTKKSKGRSTNDTENKKREEIIVSIINRHPDLEHYYMDVEHGELWKTMRTKLETTLRGLSDPDTFTRMELKQKAGMSHNYDFELTFYNNDLFTKMVQLEFKHNNHTVVDLPQFLELTDKACHSSYHLAPVSYAEFYYTNFLDEYLSCMESPVEKPDKETYLKHVTDIKYKHPFFKMLKETSGLNKKTKTAVVSKSMRAYMETFSSEFKYEEISQKIRASQKDKVYLFWDKSSLHTEKVDTSAANISHILEIKKGEFIVNVENFVYNIKIRLNWGNTNGVANPRWKFSYV